MLFVHHKTRLVYPSFQETKQHLRPVDLNATMKILQSATKSTSNHITWTTEPSALKHSKKTLITKKQKLNFRGVTNTQWQNGLVERLNGTLCVAARSMFNHAISKWEKTITAELWPLAIHHAATIYTTTKCRSRDYAASPWEQFTDERSKLDINDMHPLFCPVCNNLSLK
jgi:hypothetical protein